MGILAKYYTWQKTRQKKVALLNRLIEWVINRMNRKLKT